MKDINKVVFLGLDEAGKTTILDILSKKYSFISNIRPSTTLEQRKTEVFGYSIINWDVPGRKKLRENLTFKDTRTLQDSNVLVFVIDVQDLKRTDIALDYYERVLNKLLEGGKEQPYIAVFIHKTDPDLQENVIILKNAKRIRDEINQMSNGFNVEFYLTTMYITPSIFIGFSSVVRKALMRKKDKDLKGVLQSFADELLLNAMIVLDKNNFIVNHFERTQNDFNIIQDFVYTLNSAYKNAKIHNFNLDELKLNLKDYTFVFLPLILDTNEIFVVGSSYDIEISFIPIKSKLSLALENLIK